MIGLAAALMTNRHARWQMRGERKTLERFFAHQMFHRYRFTRAQQRPVEYGCGARGLVAAHISRDIEAPRFNPAIPVRPHERHVRPGLRIVDARRDEEA